MCIGRMAVLAAGWPVEAPGITLNRFCGSGQQAVTFAAMGIQAGHQDLVVGAGVEMMSRWPAEEGAVDFTAGNPALRERFPLVPQGVSADLIATIEGFDRDAVDAFALDQPAAGRLRHGGRPVRPQRGADPQRRRFHRPRSATSSPVPARRSKVWPSSRPSFEEMGRVVFPGFDSLVRRDVPPGLPRRSESVEHVHHAGNSSGVVDGASALVLASPEFARAHGYTPRARIVMSAVAGAEPVIMLTAPGPASRKCLERAGMTVDDIDLWEINEAFAAVPLKTIRDLGLDPEKVNVNGGAIALGHPIGATGGMLLQTALDELERRDLTTALVTMCTGGGMGTATIIERV